METNDKKFLANLGQNIKKYRKLKKYSQEKLAEILDIHYTTIGKIEIGKLNASALMLRKIAYALEVSVKDFFDFEL